ncbi:MAG: hypothetical protein JW795_09210 [Chitinivibrionales bacterium]|nr:hypothetical protein [Chitinivibrionales bacterium]
MESTMFFRISGIVYCLLMIGLGYYIWKRFITNRGGHQMTDFWIANREFPGWRFGVSLAAGWCRLCVVCSSVSVLQAQ